MIYVQLLRSVSILFQIMRVPYWVWVRTVVQEQADEISVLTEYSANQRYSQAFLRSVEIRYFVEDERREKVSSAEVLAPKVLDAKTSR